MSRQAYDVSAHAEVCHNTLVDFTGEQAFAAAADLASGPAASRPAGDVVARRLVEPHADDDRAPRSPPPPRPRTQVWTAELAHQTPHGLAVQGGPAIKLYPSRSLRVVAGFEVSIDGRF